jgi:glycosyltransferase involved in cell wall biosynthesis
MRNLFPWCSGVLVECIWKGDELISTILFAWRRLTPPGFIGGAEVTEGLWASFLAALGHDVIFIGSSENPRNPKIDSRTWLETMLHYERVDFETSATGIEYVWQNVTCVCVPQSEVLSAVRLAATRDVALVWTSQEGCDEIAELAGTTPVASYTHSVSDVGMLSANIGATFLLTPSVFVQQYLLRSAGVRSQLVRPRLRLPFDMEIDKEPRDIVLFVNPIQEKGLDVAIELARSLPEQQFVFVDGWRTYSDDSKDVPTNVTTLPRQPLLDFLYRRTQLLIVPSIIPDAAPRVVAEASLFGAVVLGSTSGAIPELVANPALNCIPPNDSKHWEERTRQLLQSETAQSIASYEQLSHIRNLFSDVDSSLQNAGILDILR